MQLRANRFFSGFSRVLKNRNAPLAILVAIVCVLILLGSMLGLPGVVERMENVLLDMRLQLRSERLTPSKDIVILAFDQATSEFSLRHPELGIPPRSGGVSPAQWGKIIRFLHERQAKTVVVDVEWKTTSFRDSQPIIEAMQAAGNVYVTLPMDLALTDYLASRENLSDQQPGLFEEGRLSGRQETPEVRERKARYTGAGFYRFYLRPFLERRAALGSMMRLTPAAGYPGLGLGPFYPVHRALLLPEEMLTHAWGYLTLRSAALQGPAADGLLNTRVGNVAPKLQALRNAFFKSECAERSLAHLLKNEPELPTALLNHSIDLSYLEKPAAAAEDQYTYCTVIPISGQLAKAAKGLGTTTVIYSDDAFIREIPLLYRWADNYHYTYLGARPALDFLNVKTLRYSRQALYAGDKTIPLTDGYKAVINWRSPKLLVSSLYKDAGIPIGKWELSKVSADRNNPQLNNGHLYRLISVSDLFRYMDGAADDLGSMHNVPSQTRSGTFSFKDKIVIIGDAVKDVHRTPVGNIVYGPEVLATVMDMLMHDRDFIRPMPGWAAILLTLGLCLGVGYSVISLPRIAMGFIVGIAIILLYWVYNFVIFSENAWWLPLVGPTIALLLTLMTATLYRYYVHDFEKRQLTQIFASYVSPQVLEKILTSPAEGLDNLRGVKKELTVLFADLKGFTRQFEHEEPEIMVRQLNEYFNVMIRIILKHNGTYDKFMGDAIMAFFGSPVDLPNHAEKACEASLEMQHALVDLNRKWVAEGMKELKVGIGLSTGPMIVGNFGSDDLKNFTVMGVSVNLGSRLENYTRHVDADVVISEATAQQIAHRAILRDLGKITVHGFTEPVQAFALDDLR